MVVTVRFVEAGDPADTVVVAGEKERFAPLGKLPQANFTVPE
jgi:hypothetical protein